MPILIDTNNKTFTFELDPQTETELNYAFIIKFYDHDLHHKDTDIDIESKICNNE